MIFIDDPSITFKPSKDIKFEGIDLSVGYNTNGEITDICVVVNNVCSPDIYHLLDNNVADRIAEQFYKEMGEMSESYR